jgi:tartrate dehydrogenase/decarboxylase/D-malate dehydrogenase
MKTQRIAVIAGDGIGKEVIPAGIEIIKLAAEQSGFTCEFTEFRGAATSTCRPAA